MPIAICERCMQTFDLSPSDRCPHCGGEPHHHANSDAFLMEAVPRVVRARKEAGLDGLVGGLSGVIINTEPDRQRAAVDELLRTTGHEFAGAFEDEGSRTSVLRRKGSAEILVRSRKGFNNPFSAFNIFPKARHLPNTRLETFVFRCRDLEKYVEVQKARGVEFLTDGIVHADEHSFIQTIPSGYTGLSLGFVEWKGSKEDWRTPDAADLDWHHQKPADGHIAAIGILDHTATRVRAEDRDAAIIEFMNLTNYEFQFAIYVKVFNSITNVARLSAKDFAMVFTSGITPFAGEEASGPTERFIRNYGTRVHHMAFATERVEETFEGLKQGGMGFLIDLVGSPEEGLKQTFSGPSENTLLVNEYIQRYGDFDGFFSKSNVTLLTGATAKQ